MNVWLVHQNWSICQLVWLYGHLIDMPSHQHEKSTCWLVSMLTVKSDRRILNCGNLCHLFGKLTIIVSKLITLSETWLIGDLACRWLDLLASYLRLLCCYLRCCSFHHYWQLRLQFSIWNKLPVKIRNSLSFAVIVKRNTHTHTRLMALFPGLPG